MQLWTEYEGRKIEGTYTLGKLLRSEGRNGFFATSDTTGNAAVIRLTEAHYDEDELLQRWRQVAGMHQDNLINIERFGQTNFEGVAITYALMEANDANLGDVLRERPLTVTETMQVARSVHSALAALHAAGLVHEHIEPVNVLAVGETVKLRSDCVRECIADTEFNTPEGCAELRRRDVHDFGMLLLQCLTLEKRYNPGLNLPDVFRRLIPHMLDGTWSLDQIGQLVNPPATAPVPSAVPASSATTKAARQQPQPATASASRSPGFQQPEQGRLPLDQPRPPLHSASDPAVQSRRNLSDEPSGFPLGPWLLGGLAAAIVCIIVIWHFVGAKPAKSVQTTAAVQSAPAVVGTAPLPASAETNTPAPVAAHSPGWYVIAYTYNRQGQAQHKADSLNERHKGFHAEVFTPRGAAPYLVSLGGPMSEPDAKVLQQRARHSGFPGDTYIRNYR
jgi:eukaryotic-like serine/threonine-protein kinase